MKKLKSNFFKSAKKDTNLSHVEIKTTTEINDKPVFNKISVPYNKFDDFMLVDSCENEKRDTKKDNEAIIFIIAPVLVEGVNTYWKGYYKGSPIDFKVVDNDFLSDIYSHDIKFGNGTYIDCELVATTVIKTGTSKENILREVIYVKEIGDDRNFKRPIKHRKNIPDNYTPSLFPNDSRIE